MAKKIMSFGANISEIAYLESVAKNMGCSTSGAIRMCITEHRDYDDLQTRFDQLDQRFTTLINTLKPIAAKCVSK
ncbi:hypothetical protein [Mariprofundus ferrooxydans]|uniref:hypothetical protein n=1 Tax=Mariprofundus ferrooxydans TaxID=314344 RepID=UPI00142FF94D|nr:hypothetical protein [Mariprofundus ferrooxydans]